MAKQFLITSSVRFSQHMNIRNSYKKNNKYKYWRTVHYFNYSLHKSVYVIIFPDLVSNIFVYFTLN